MDNVVKNITYVSLWAKCPLWTISLTQSRNKPLMPPTTTLPLARRAMR